MTNVMQINSLRNNVRFLLQLSHRITTRMCLCVQQRWTVSRLIEAGFDLGRFRQKAEKTLLDKYLAAAIESQ